MTLKELSEAVHREECKRHKMPPEYISLVKFKDTSTNELTKCVMAFLLLHGCQRERVANTGRYIPAKEYKDVLGITRQMGKGKWIKGSGVNGTSDVHSTVPIMVNGIRVGVSVKWEIKCKATKDKIRDKQPEYKQKVDAAGGFVYYVPDFETFYKHWIELHEQFK